MHLFEKQTEKWKMASRMVTWEALYTISSENEEMVNF